MKQLVAFLKAVGIVLLGVILLISLIAVTYLTYIVIIVTFVGVLIYALYRILLYRKKNPAPKRL